MPAETAMEVLARHEALLRDLRAGAGASTGTVQSGHVFITPTAANTPTAYALTFPQAFPAAPVVVATPETSGPGTVVTGVGARDVTATGCNLYLTRTDTTVTGVWWIAHRPAT
jgi:hypothetical protein